MYTLEYIWYMEETHTRMFLEVLFLKGNKQAKKKEITQMSTNNKLEKKFSYNQSMKLKTATKRSKLQLLNQNIFISVSYCCMQKANTR